MSYDLGAVVPLSITITDADGNPANAGAVTITITLPDGTSSTTPVTAGEVGQYDFDYQTVQAGRHVIRWVATGSNAGAFTDVFDVDPADAAQIVSLADAKDHLNLSAGRTVDDAELMRIIRAATLVVERYVGSVARRTHVETFDADGTKSSLLLGHPPILSATSVVEDGTTLVASDYRLGTASGILTRVSAGAPYPWRAGSRVVRVTYVAGRTVVDPAWRLAALIIIGHMWATQRNAGGGRPALGGELESGDVDSNIGYTVPYRALELLGEPALGIA